MEIKGATQVVQNLSKFDRAVIDELVYACEAVQQEVKNQAQAVVPYLTGNLQGSIREGGIIVEDDNVTAIVGAYAPYAAFVEFGTSRMGAQPYLVPALVSNQGTFRKAVVAAFKRAREAMR